VPPPLTPAEIEARTATFMEDARRALANKEPGTAINRLNRILGLPPNSQTEAAQALIGEAREQNGELLKARAEYELYLKLFPEGPSAARVRERLAALPKGELAARAPRPRPKEAGPSEWFFSGSLSSYYYTGKSQIDTLVPPPPGMLTFNRDTLSMVDQRSLISSVNLHARRRDAFSDTRIVFRDTDHRNYLDSRRSYNRVYAAYVDHNDRQIGYYARAGRQNPSGMGVLERFDGLQGGYNLNPEWRVNAVYGDAVEFLSPFKKNFYGASIDLLPQTGRPGISLYAIDQTLDGLSNRRAVGTEVRFFDGRASAYGMLDYDVLYKAVNILMLQGNYLDEAGNNYFVVLDHRRAPSLSLTNALLAAPGLSVKEMVRQQGIDEVRAQAKALAATSNMFSVGVTHPLSERWLVGADYRLAAISATQPVVATIPLGVIGTCLGTIDVVNNTCIFNTASQQGSGNNHVVTFQAIGNSLFVPNAVGVANLSLIKAPTYNGQALGLTYMLPFAENWRLDANLRYYTQRDNDGTHQTRLSPSLKIGYQWRNKLHWEGEIGREASSTSGPTREDRVKRDYLFTGLRWDFH
jgi:tetratricopeptide (TPR) repeat protein